MAKRKSAIEAATETDIAHVAHTLFGPHNPAHARLASRMARLLPADPDQGEQVLNLLAWYYFCRVGQSLLSERLAG